MSYKLDKSKELAREHLVRLERMEDPGTIACLEKIGVAEGWSCLEVGGGGGSVAAWLCERVGPTGQVLVTDIDTSFLEPLHSENLIVRQHDIVKDDLEVEAFDLAHERNVLIHIPERKEVLTKMVNAIKPGGWLLIEEGDMVTDSAAPGVPAPMATLYREVTEAIYTYLRKEGLALNLGAQLMGLLRALGLQSVHAEGRVTMFHGGTSDARSPHMTAFAHLKDAVVADGYVSEQRYSDFLELQDNPSFAWREGLTMAAWGRRPSVAP